MASNLTIESPNFEKINKEAGQFTSDAVATLWAALNDTRAALRRDFRQAKETAAYKLLSLAPASGQNNLDLGGASIVSFIGTTAVDVTGFRAPETGESQVLFIQVSGSGTITLKNTATSETANQIATTSGSDVALSTGKGIVLAYLASKWRQVV